MQQSSNKTDTPNSIAILAEAGRCLLELGINKTTVKIIVSRLGISRQTFYRTFENRDDMLAALYLDQFNALIFFHVNPSPKQGKFAESLLESTVLTIELTKQNKIMMELMHGSGTSWFQDQMLNRNTSLYQRLIRVGHELWAEKLDESRTNNEINPKLSNSEIFEWLISIHYMMIIRTDASQADHIALVEKLVIPSLTNF